MKKSGKENIIFYLNFCIIFIYFAWYCYNALYKINIWPAAIWTTEYKLWSFKFIRYRAEKRITELLHYWIIEIEKEGEEDFYV